MSQTTYSYPFFIYNRYSLLPQVHSFLVQKTTLKDAVRRGYKGEHTTFKFIDGLNLELTLNDLQITSE